MLFLLLQLYFFQPILVLPLSHDFLLIFLLLTQTKVKDMWRHNESKSHMATHLLRFSLLLLLSSLHSRFSLESCSLLLCFLDDPRLPTAQLLLRLVSSWRIPSISLKAILYFTAILVNLHEHSILEITHLTYVWSRAPSSDLVRLRLTSGLRRTFRAARCCFVFAGATTTLSSSEQAASARSSILKWSRTDTSDSVEPLDERSYSRGFTLPVGTGMNFDVTGRGRALMLGSIRVSSA